MRILIDLKLLNEAFPSLSYPFFHLGEDYKIKKHPQYLRYNKKLNEMYYKSEIDDVKVNNLDLYNSLKDLMALYKITEELTPSFYYIYCEYERLIGLSIEYSNENNSLKKYTEAQSNLLNIIKKVFKEKQPILKIIIETSDKKYIINNADSIASILNEVEYPMIRLKYWIEEYLSDDPIRPEIGRGIEERKKYIRYLNNCLKKYCELLKVDFNSHDSQIKIPDKSIETFVHDYLHLCGYLKYLGFQDYESYIAKTHSPTDIGKIRYCEKRKLF